MRSMPRQVHVDVFGHGLDGERIAGELDHRDDRVADDIALAGREVVHHRTRRARTA